MNTLTFDPAPIEKGPPRSWNLPEWAIVPAWVMLPVALFVARYFTLSLSSFGWYHGFNEAVYTEIAAGYLYDNWWLPMRNGAPFFDTGPFTTYMMALSYDVLDPWAGSPGAEESAMRFGVLVAYPIAIWAAHRAGEGFYGPGRGKIAAILVATSPWVLLWFGRAQTDAWMTTGILLFLAGFAKPAGKRGGALIIGGLTIALLSKQPAILALAAAPFIQSPRNLRSLESQRTWILTATGVILGLTWWAVMAWLHPAAFGTSVHFHVEDRSMPFENWVWTLFFGLLVGSGALAFFVWKWRRPRMALLFPFCAFTAFAIYDAPTGHEYYALPAVAILGVMAAGWKWDTPSLAACVVGSLLLAAGIFVYTGEFDDTQTREMGYDISVWALSNEFWPKLEPNETVYAPSRLVPQLHLYSGGRPVLEDKDFNQTKGGFIISWDLLDCKEMSRTVKTMSNPPLRLYDCATVT